MADDIDWDKEVSSLNALIETQIMWLQIGHACRDWALGGLDCLEEIEYADRAIEYAKRAEACFWRATGECAAIDIPPTLTSNSDGSPQGEDA